MTFIKNKKKKRNEHMKVLSDQLDELDNLDYRKFEANIALFLAKLK